MAKKVSTQTESYGGLPAYAGSAPVAVDKPKSSVNFNFHSRHGKFMPKGVGVGQKHSVTLTGKVTGLRSGEYGHSLDMDLDSVQHDTDADAEQENATTNEVGTALNQTQATPVPSSLTGALRKRHGGTGRFIG